MCIITGIIYQISDLNDFVFIYLLDLKFMITMNAVILLLCKLKKDNILNGAKFSELFFKIYKIFFRNFHIKFSQKHLACYYKTFFKLNIENSYRIIDKGAFWREKL